MATIQGQAFKTPRIASGDVFPFDRPSLPEGSRTGKADSDDFVAFIIAAINANPALINQLVLEDPNGWNASTNTPTLSDATGVPRKSYIVTAAGTQTLGVGNTLDAEQGDLIFFDEAAGKYFIGGNITTSLNSTADLPDATGFRYVTENEKDALAAVNNPISAANPVADVAWVNTQITTLELELAALAAGTTINVTSGEVEISVVEDGVNVSGLPGTTTRRFLNTLIDPATGVNYTNASAAARWPRSATLWGTIDVTTWTYDDACLQELPLLMLGNVTAVYAHNRKFVVNLPNGYIAIPASTLTNSNITAFKQNAMLMDGRYSTIRVGNTDADTAVFYRHASSLSNAQNGNQNYLEKKIEITRWIFVGQNGVNSCGINLWASNLTEITKCYFYNFGTGIEERFCLNAVIEKCNFYNIDNYGIYTNLITSSIWADVTDPGGQTTSQVSITHCRISVKVNGVGIYFRGGDSGNVVHNTIEVESGEVGDAGIVYDNAGSVNSKGNLVYGNHFEGQFADAWIRLRLSANCTCIIGADYVQSPVLENSYLVNLVNVSGSNCVIIRDMGNHSGGGGWKLKYCYNGAVTGVPGGGGGFVFENTMLPGNPNDPSEIVGNSAIWKLTTTDTATGYAFVSPLQSRTILRNRPL